MTRLSLYAEYDGRPWDDDGYSNISLGPLILGIIVCYIVFYLIPKVASKGSNRTKTRTNTPSKHSHVDLTPEIRTRYVKCTNCNGTGHIVDIEEIKRNQESANELEAERRKETEEYNKKKSLLLAEKEKVRIERARTHKNFYESFDDYSEAYTSLIHRRYDIGRKLGDELQLCPKCPHCDGDKNCSYCKGTGKVNNERVTSILEEYSEIRKQMKELSNRYKFYNELNELDRFRGVSAFFRYHGPNRIKSIREIIDDSPCCPYCNGSGFIIEKT